LQRSTEPISACQAAVPLATESNDEARSGEDQAAARNEQREGAPAVLGETRAALCNQKAGEGANY
jgi:hypothetical protein